MEKKLFLIDGHSLIFRMYYAFFKRPMINSKHRDVSILFGFTKYLLEIISREKPTHMAVAFDPPGKTFRHSLYPQYKANRQATPELVIEALEPLTEICAALGIPVLMKPGFEGDDVLGSMAVQSAAKGFTVFMVTPDKDFGQLVTESIFQLKPGKSGGENELLGPRELCAKLGIRSPAQVIDLLTLCGDSADNVPGVNGIGEVGASKLISKYGSVENIYAHLDELPARQAEQMRAAQDHIALSKLLVTIKTDIPLDEDEESLRLSSEYGPDAVRLFDFYEFASLRKFLKNVPSAGDAVKIQVPAGRKIEWLVKSGDEVMKVARETGTCAIVLDSSFDNVFSTIGKVTVATSDDNGNCLVACGDVDTFKPILQDENIEKFGYGLKMACSLLSNAGITLRGRLNDIELMHYILDPEVSHKAEILSRGILGIELDAEPQDAASEVMPGLFDTVSEDRKDADRSREAVICLLLGKELLRRLSDAGMLQLFLDIEEPLERVLAGMERCGVKVDMSVLHNYSLALAGDLAEIEAKVRKECGEPSINLSSPKQLGVVLYEKLRIDPRLKEKKSYPTDEDTLLRYAENFPVIYDILEYRGLKKLINTYIDPFPSYISSVDGRVHTTFNQALTATGRLSSSRPNLQNIPIRTERGRFIRKAFVASSPDKVIISADYSQIELRLMAHFCGDEHMRSAFCEGKDVHAITASKIFKIPLEQVTDEMRRTAKTANFGIMYGISAFGLAERLKIPRVAAKKIIEDYFESFPLISKWIEQTRQTAREEGYVQTLYGRRRYLPDINSRNATVRALAERNAVNAPIQGTAADIIKIAMNRVDAAMRRRGLESIMVLQIHDELLFEAPRFEVDEMMSLIKEEMENVIELSVPLTVECNYGKDWLEAH